MSEKEKNTEIEEKTTEKETSDVEEAAKIKEADASDTDSENVYEQLRTTNENLKDNKEYRRGKLIYDLGFSLLSIVMILNALRYFLQIEIIFGTTCYSSAIVFLYIIPCLVMLTGLIISHKAAVKSGQKSGDRIGITVVAVITVLIAGLAVMEMIHPSYKIYETEELTLRDGQTLIIAKSDRITITDSVPDKAPTVHDIDVYKREGIFSKRLISRGMLYGNWRIEPGDKENEYLFIIKNSGKEESIPFYY